MQITPKYLEIVKSRAKRKLKLKRVYRNIRNKELFLKAYSIIYANKGATTKGADNEDTVDGMSIRRIEKIILKLKAGKYKWKPVKRIEIPKSNGKIRPISIPGWNDKLLQKVLEIVLNEYYESQFKNSSHGFRPARGCHTALKEIQYNWNGIKWFIECDIRGCFDNINQSKLLEIIGRNIEDNRILKLLKDMMEVGYITDWRYEKTLSGIPQGSIISPLLANIYMNELDKFIEEELIPEYNRGKKRTDNREYGRINYHLQKAKKKKDYESYQKLKKYRRTLPTKDTHDENYRRLKYIRYADDFLLGFAGPKIEAEAIKKRIKDFLRKELGLEMSEEKTLITHATRDRARFLGYDIKMGKCNNKCYKGKRSINGQPLLQVPREIVSKHLKRVSKNGKPYQRVDLLDRSDFEIVFTYNAEFQGLLNYYYPAYNVTKRLSKLRYFYMSSLLKTLANKHRTSSNSMQKKYHKRFETGTKGLEVKIERAGKKPLKARFGAKPFRREKYFRITDKIVKPRTARRCGLIQRLLNDTCELCGSKENIEIHHVRKLKDLKNRYKGRKEPPTWVQLMIARNRKTLASCRSCHRKIHSGTLSKKT